MIVQISKIQLRRGFEIDLGGAPVSLNPLTFGPGLDVGEIAFATDSGRLFIGHEPGAGNPNHRRVTFPYQNVEVLTENSTTVLREIDDNFKKTTRMSAYHQGPMTVSSDWADVTTYTGGLYRVEGDRFSASLEYVVVDNAGNTVRSGDLRANGRPSQTEAACSDMCVTARRLDLTGVDALDSAQAFRNVEFRFVFAGGTQDPHWTFQYRNYLNTTMTLYFQITKA